MMRDTRKGYKNRSRILQWVVYSEDVFNSKVELIHGCILRMLQLYLCAFIRCSGKSVLMKFDIEEYKKTELRSVKFVDLVISILCILVCKHECSTI